MPFDILVRGGTLVDGSGAASIRADLAIEGGRIAAIGPDLSHAAENVIDATGLVVAPGFIDIKTHSDFTLPINPTADSKVRQGVTTEIIGHCGFSVAPALPGKVELLRDYLSPSAPWLPFRAMRFPEYLDTFPSTSVNAGMLVGHNTLRLMAIGMDNRPPRPDELALMAELLDEGLCAGALGMSSGLFTAPGSYAEPDEIHALCAILARHRAGYFTHLRDESDRVLEAVEEAVAVAEAFAIHVEIVHFKCSGVNNWGKAARVLEMLAAARARGADIDCDAYPYTAGSNPLKNLMPQWVQDGGVEAMLGRLPLAETRARIRSDIARDGLNNWGRIPSWDSVQVSISPHLAQYSGRTIASIAAEWSKDPVDAACDYLVADRGATRVLVHAISEDDVAAIMASPEALVGSDGNCVATEGTTSQGRPHPRFYGTFPRVLSRYVGDPPRVPLEIAIHKMTGATARALRLADRGLLRQGFRADVVLFDPSNFADRATYDQPHQYPSGAHTHVIVDGHPVVAQAKHTGARPGKVLRRLSSGMVA